MTKLELIININNYLMEEHDKVEREMAEVKEYATKAIPSSNLLSLSRTIENAKKSERCMAKQEIILGVLEILANS